jgi:hypothetical protein
MRRVDHSSLCYFMAAAILPEPRCEDVREILRPLARKSARRIHWRDEEEPAKSIITKAIAATGAEFLVVVGTMAAHQNQERSRALVLKRLLFELDQRQVGHLVLESRHSERDRHDLTAIGRFRNARLVSRRLRVSHGGPLEEPLLWLPDAVAGAAGDDRCGHNALHRHLMDLVNHIDLGAV